LQIRIGDIFRVPGNVPLVDSRYPDLRFVSRGRHLKGINPYQGMFFFRNVTDSEGVERRPAFVFLSNNLKPASASNPWLDVIDPDSGFAFYHGDNRLPGRTAFAGRGNNALNLTFGQYGDPALRKLAPPILIFEQAAVDGKIKGYRKFAGFGVPTGVRLQTQAMRNERFVNLAIDIALFGLEAEDELFDWDWIDDRRDRSMLAERSNKRAPRSWKTWVRDGDVSIERVRRNVVRDRIHRATERRMESAGHRMLLERVHQYYQSTPHGFEGLASFVTQRILGPNCTRGWVTPRSGDGGIDFVNRLDIGSGMAATSAVILGQAKNKKPLRPVAGHELARVVARLRRGWVGAFVTTGVFTDSAQRELIEDEYPVLLVDGVRVAEEIQKVLAAEGIGLGRLLDRETRWYESNVSRLRPEHILAQHRAGTPARFGSA
jgi:hypothetical protein